MEHSRGGARAAKLAKDIQRRTYSPVYVLVKFVRAVLSTFKVPVNSTTLDFSPSNMMQSVSKIAGLKIPKFV